MVEFDPGPSKSIANHLAAAGDTGAATVWCVPIGFSRRPCI